MNIYRFTTKFKQFWSSLNPGLKLWTYWITIPEIIFLIMLFIYSLNKGT